MNDFPPAGYVRAPSAVSGIELFMPRPPEERLEETVAFHCPQCDATTAYCAANGGLTCTHCGYYEPPAVEVVGRAATEFEFTVETMERAAHGWGIERKELACDRCGAHTTLSTDKLTHTCPFCGSNQVVQVRAAQDLLRPRFLVPFTITEDECRQRAKAWLGGSWMVPKDLQRLARTAEFTPIFIPYWTFDARAQASWRAEVAHTRTKTVYVNGKPTTRTVTEWRWESGSVNLFHDDVLVQGSERLSPLLLQKVQGFDLNGLVPYDPSFLAGLSAQAYDTGLEAAWEIGRNIMRQKTKKSCQSQATSQRMRNFSMSLDFSEESWRYILLPLYLAAYPYGQARYQVMVNGQTGAIAGQRPVDWRKVALAAGGALLPGLILGAIALYLSSRQIAGDALSILGFAGVIALVGALAFIIYAVSTAVKMDDI